MKSLFLIKQVKSKYNERQHFHLSSLSNIWEGGRQAMCLEPGHYAVEQMSILEFDVEEAGTFNGCTHYILKHPRHQDLLVFCQTGDMERDAFDENSTGDGLDNLNAMSLVDGGYDNGVYYPNVDVATVSEPSVLMMVALGMAALVKFFSHRG